MCAVSMISDHYMNKFNQNPYNPYNNLGGGSAGGSSNISLSNPVSRIEFDELKKDIIEMKELLKRAVEYDKRTGQPDCEMKEKVAALKRISEIVGVSLEDVFEPIRKA